MKFFLSINSATQYLPLSFEVKEIISLFNYETLGPHSGSIHNFHFNESNIFRIWNWKVAKWAKGNKFHNYVEIIRAHGYEIEEIDRDGCFYLKFSKESFFLLQLETTNKAKVIEF